MTTIVADIRLGVMVSDSSVSDDDRVWSGRKVRRWRDSLIGFAGDVDEAMMTPQRADQLCLRTEYLLDAMESPDIPPAWRERAARILGLAPHEVAPPQPELVSTFAEPVHEHEPE